MLTKMQRNERDKTKRDHNAAAGLCRCGGARDSHWKLCPRCRDVVKAKSSRRHRPDVARTKVMLLRGISEASELDGGREVEYYLRMAYKLLIGGDEVNDTWLAVIDRDNDNLD